MTGFSADWLTLREPADHRARNPALLDHVGRWLTETGRSKILDLGSGTGSTMRAFTELPLIWRLVDADQDLLLRAAELDPRVETRRIDLAADVEAVLDPAFDLVTCSALLDLVSGLWFERFVTFIQDRNLPFYAALIYDGTTVLTPKHESDPAVLRAFHRDMLRDKGFGPALGPMAATVIPTRLEAAGFTVTTGRSDWHLDDQDAALQRALVEGWAQAAGQTLPKDAIDSWHLARLDWIDAGVSRFRIGHLDVVALPG